MFHYLCGQSHRTVSIFEEKEEPKPLHRLCLPSISGKIGYTGVHRYTTEPFLFLFQIGHSPLISKLAQLMHTHTHTYTHLHVSFRVNYCDVKLKAPVCNQQTHGVNSDYVRSGMKIVSLCVYAWPIVPEMDDIYAIGRHPFMRMYLWWSLRTL